MVLDELRGLLERHVRPDLTTAIEGVRVCRVDRAGSPVSSMSGTVLAVIARGGKRLALGERVYDYGAGQYLVASVDLPVTGQAVEAAPGRPALGFGMTLEPAVITELLLQARPGDLPRPSGTARPGIAVSDAPDDLLDAVVRLLRLLDRPRDRKVMAPLVKREILWLLMTGGRAAPSASSASRTAAGSTSPGRCAGSGRTTPGPSGLKRWRVSRE